MGYTRIVGINAGIEAVRTVRNEGMILFMKEKIYIKELIPFVGKKVFICEMDGEMWIYTVEYQLYNTTCKKEPIPRKGNWITTRGKKWISK